MLRRLSVNDIVLIDRLDLEFDDGLAALTGETGAGKSILLDSLGLALGARSDASLIRPSAEQASVTAVFEMHGGGAVRDDLAESGIEVEDGDLLIRRLVTKDGRSRAFINDQPVTVGLLRKIGERLVEIHGQYERYGLMNPSSHQAVLDTFGVHDAPLAETRRTYQAWREAEQAAAKAGEAIAQARADRERLAQLAEELDELAPAAGEETSLAARRELLQQTEKMAAALAAVDSLLAGDNGASPSLHRALRELSSLEPVAADHIAPATAALERADVEIEEGLRALQAVLADIESDPQELERVEERLFALRALARRNGCTVDELPALHADVRSRLDQLANEGEHLTLLAQQAEERRRAFLGCAEKLSKKRAATAKRLQTAVAKELPPLHLGQAELRVQIERLPEPQWGPAGVDQVSFEARTNTGMAFGPIQKVASGGELSRFLLALKVIMAAAVQTPTLIFDEVDAGVSGATAAAIGERLARLSQERQVLAVTHSPQVAARAQLHLRVKKKAAAKTTVTEVDVLPAVARREEIARMLSGSEVTEEARAAADRLMARNTA